jgi:catechol 2,3-dioxygenase-like lactoylglutathione lyase family enzyme
MFRGADAFNSFSVDDLDRAKQFYGDTLGLEVSEEPQGLVLRLGGGGRVFVYSKDDHEPATFTILNFPVEDIESAVTDLADKGVSFEQYEGSDERGIHRGDFGPAMAWFKDPAGNFISVLEDRGS